MKNKRRECSVKPLLSESGLSQTLSNTATLTVSVSLFISVANLCSNFPTCRCVHLISTLHLLLSISSPTTTTPQNHLSALSGSPPLLLLLPLLLLSVSPPPTTPLALLSLQTISKAANFGFVASRQSPSPLFQLLPAVTAALVSSSDTLLLA